MSMNDVLNSLRDAVTDAAARGATLDIQGSGSKSFYGNPANGEAFSTLAYNGVIDYEPTELVLSARCGTPLSYIEQLLYEEGQMLAFEPPHFGPQATLGGCIATGLSGPRRASAGSARDFVLGARLLDGRGQVLSFGGRVMKNVAGYDVSRLLTGSMGILGVIVEVSLKVLPLPAASATRIFELDEKSALTQLNRWAGQPLPISASCWHLGRLHVRLDGAHAAVQTACQRLGGEDLDPASALDFWTSLGEHEHSFFSDAQAKGLPLWRVSLPSTSDTLFLNGSQLIEWGGALRWWATHAPAAEVRAAARGGHATLFRATPGTRASQSAFQTPDPAILDIHRRLKAEFDPAGLFNRGRMFPDL